jgi:hypothetical protein
MKKSNGVRGKRTILVITLRSARSGPVHELEDRDTLTNGVGPLARARSQDLAPSFGLYKLDQSTTVGKEINILSSDFDDLQVLNRAWGKALESDQPKFNQ